MDSSNMLSDNSSKQANGDLSKKDPEVVISFSPRPQRVLRLNRRGFFLSDRVRPDKESPGINLKNSKNNQHKDSSPGQGTTNGSQKLTSPVSSERKVIKLNTSTKYSSTESVNKRSSNESDLNTVNEETPPKKKHKLITWP